MGHFINTKEDYQILYNKNNSLRHLKVHVKLKYPLILNPIGYFIILYFLYVKFQALQVSRKDIILNWLELPINV